MRLKQISLPRFQTRPGWYDTSMDAGIVTILVSTAISTATVGIALAALMVRLIRGLARSLGKQVDTLRDDIRELRHGQAVLRDRVSDLSDRVSRIEGLLEGLREAIAGRHATAAD